MIHWMGVIEWIVFGVLALGILFGMAWSLDGITVDDVEKAKGKYHD